jgi:hypothetical protein
LDNIRELKRGAPFVPFTIIVTSGDRYEIVDPELLVVGLTEVFYCFPRSDRVVFIRANQIVALERHQPQSAA